MNHKFNLIIQQLGAKIANLEIEKATAIAEFEAYRQEVEKNGTSESTTVRKK